MRACGTQRGSVQRCAAAAAAAAARRTYSTALRRMENELGKEDAYAICSYDITTATRSWSEAFDLIGVGPYFGHPQTLLALWDGPYLATLFTATERASVLPAHATDSFSLLRDANGQLHALCPLFQKQDPVFIIRYICAVIPCAIIALSTGNRISPVSFSLQRFSCAGLTGYLLPLPRRLNRGERAFCGIEAICIAN